MKPGDAGQIEGPGTGGAERSNPTARTGVSVLGLGALGLAMMALSAGSAWLIRGLQDAEPTTPNPDPIAGSHGIEQPGAKSSGLQAGRLAYQVYCARCHGPEGRGDGADAAVLRPPPRDLTANRWAHGESAEAVRSVLRNGVPGTAMTGWGHLLSPPQFEAVAEYVQSLRAPAADSVAKEQWQSLLRRARFEPVGKATIAPSITFHDLDGHERSLDHERGKGILLVFWGTTCAPCVAELPALDRLASEFDGNGLAVLPICVDEADVTVVREIARVQTKHLPLYVDRTGLARLRYEVQTLPCAVLIDDEGRMLGRSEGGQEWQSEDVREVVRELATGSVRGE